MRALSSISVFLIFLVLTARGASVTHYVDVNSANPVAPYLSWGTAAKTIQDAVNSANNSDTVLVTNGVYSNGGASNSGSSRVSITKSIALQSVNGRDVTIIQGQADPYTTFGSNSTRCVYVGASSVSVIGFTLTNGTTDSMGFNSGGGLYASQGGLLSDCLIVGCRAADGGGGIDCGSPSPLIVSNCILSANSAPTSSGGAARYAVFYNCIITNNSAKNGGGVWAPYSYPGSLTGCFVGNNHASFGGGAYNCNITNCVFAYNSATNYGGAIYDSYDTIVFNCLVVSNSAILGGGLFGGAPRNCTIVGNSAGQGGGFFILSAPLPVTSAANSILYYNSATNGANWVNGPSGADFCCTIPPLSSHDITNEPAFVNLLAGDFHLQSNSPCVNSGRNGYVPGSADLDGNPRIRGGTVDLGAYEYQNPTSLLSYGWLQQYGFAIDGSADFADSDGDGMNNWQEWISSTDPMDPASFLHVLPPHRVQTGVTLTWPAITDQIYFIQRATNASFPSWVNLQTNISTKLTPTNVATYTDTSATKAGPYFYRVGTSR